MPPLNFLNISVLVLYFDWCDNFHFVKNPVMLHEYVFVLIPDMGYGAVSNCPQRILGGLEKVFVWHPQDGLWWLLLCLLLSVPFAAVPAPDFAIDELLFGCLVWLLVRYIMMIDFGLTKTNIRCLHTFSSLTFLYYWVLVGNIVLKKTVGRVVDNTVQ